VLTSSPPSCFAPVLQRDGLLLSEELSLNIALRNHLLPTIEKATGASYVRGAGMQITLALHHASIAEEARGLLSEAGPSAKTGRKRKHGWHGRGGAATAGVAPGHELLVKQCSRRALQEAAEALSDGQLEERCGMPPRPNLSEPAAAAVRCMRRADGGASGGAYLLAGRYRKLRRGLSQSPWIIDGAQKGSGSVQELIESWAMPHLKADSCKFVTAGREDIDVRMLGNGRPFILEIFNPRSLMPPPEVWETLAKDLKQADLGVEVVAPQGVSRDLYSRMKEGESEKEKTYAAVVWLSRAITPDDIAAIGAYQVCTPTHIPATGPSASACVPSKGGHPGTPVCSYSTPVCFRVLCAPWSPPLLSQILAGAVLRLYRDVLAEPGHTAGDPSAGPAPPGSLDAREVDPSHEHGACARLPAVRGAHPQDLCRDLHQRVCARGLWPHSAQPGVAPRLQGSDSAVGRVGRALGLPVLSERANGAGELKDPGSGPYGRRKHFAARKYICLAS